MHCCVSTKHMLLRNYPAISQYFSKSSALFTKRLESIGFFLKFLLQIINVLAATEAI